MVGGEEKARQIIGGEFPDIPFLALPAYNIQYSGNRSNFMLKLVQQVPAILKVKQEEKTLLEKYINDYQIDGIISDNRFGLYAANKPCVYITHQLHIETGVNIFNAVSQRIHYSIISKFSECWVPDAAGGQNLAGKLSHPHKMPHLPVKYLGPLTRLKTGQAKIENDLLILLSGPEPQRSIFEEKIIRQLHQVRESTVLVRGLPHSEEKLLIENPRVKIFNHLKAAELNDWILSSKMVIARGGYTTIMDLAVIGKQALLVPTPSQTEQEYLCGYIAEKKYFLTQSQEQFGLTEAIERLSAAQCEIYPMPDGQLSQTIFDWLQKVKAK